MTPSPAERVKGLTPETVTDLEMAFPARVCGRLLPPWDEIPDRFKLRGEPWVDLVERWFFKGLPGDVRFHARDGINAEKAFRHVRACMGSFEPKHEHKEAGCAYLLSEFFEKVEIPSEKKSWP